MRAGRNITILTIIFLCAFGAFCLDADISKATSDLSAINVASGKEAPVRNIFFHSLILYPELAFSKNDKAADIFKNYMITKTEFMKILRELYKNKFVLIDIKSIYGVDSTGNVFSKNPEVPAGKKPLILSLDDLSYYNFMKGRGFASKLVLDKDGNVATQVITPEGKTLITRDGDAVPIIDDFVKTHPDFSVNGAKGVIALTGYQGILGYRMINSGQADDAKNIVEKLKATGWRFASHSYSHDKSFGTGKISLDDLKIDTQKWNKEIEPLVGGTDIYVGPFGQIFKEADSRRKYLVSQGFKSFLGVGMDVLVRYYSDNFIMDRADIDGYRLRNTPDALRLYFDPQLVIDK